MTKSKTNKGEMISNVEQQNFQIFQVEENKNQGKTCGKIKELFSHN